LQPDSSYILTLKNIIDHVGNSLLENKKDFKGIVVPVKFPLVFISGCECEGNEKWDNAVDGDWDDRGELEWNGTTTAIRHPNNCCAIFGFADNQVHSINRIRLICDTPGAQWTKKRWVKRFSVQVSTSDTKLSDFTTVLKSAKKRNGEWEEYSLTPVRAKYLRLIIEETMGDEEYAQIGEFEALGGGETPVELASIQVNYPDGGEILLHHSTCTILWQSNYVKDSVRIEYSDENGSKWYEIAYTANDGEFTWIVPSLKSTKCLVKISAISDESLFDCSDLCFAIESKVSTSRSGKLDLVLYEHSGTQSGEGWENAIDNDWTDTPEDWSGTVTAIGDTCFANFGFDNDEMLQINKVRLITDTRVGNWDYIRDRWVKKFTVQVSTTDRSEDAFSTLVLDQVKKKGGGWQDYEFDPVVAKYIKLTINEPASGLRQLGEFEIYASEPTLTVVSPNGGEIIYFDEPCNILWTPIEPQQSVKIQYSLDNGMNWNAIINETEDDGEYKWSVPGVTSKFGLIRISAVADDSISDQSDSPFRIAPSFAFTNKLNLVLFEHSDHELGEGWDNAIDNDWSDSKGDWSGTVTAYGHPCYAIFGFSNGEVQRINRIRMITDTGVGNSIWITSRWIQNFTVKISTTDRADTSFSKVVLNRAYKSGGDWQEYQFEPVHARYVKLIIDKPDFDCRQLGEFEVYSYKPVRRIRRISRK